MSETRFDPLKEISRLGDTVGRVIEQGIQQVQGGLVTQAQTLKVDIYEYEGQVVVKTNPIDNLVPESLEVSMEQGVLTISGTTRGDNTPELASFLLQERRFGPFTRSVEIPLPVKSSQAKAKLGKNGTLTITIPVDSEAQDLTVHEVDE